MAEEQEVPATTSAGAGTQQQTVPATEKPGASPELTERLTKLERQLNFLVTKETKQAKAEKTDSGEETQKARIDRLEGELKKRDEMAIAAVQKAEISRAIIGHGIIGEAAKDLEARLYYEYGKHIKNRDNGVPVVEDFETGEQFLISDFIATKYLRGQNGDRFKVAPAAGPETKGLGTRQAGSGARRTFGELSTEEQDKLMKEGKAGAYVKEDLASGR